MVPVNHWTQSGGALQIVNMSATCHPCFRVSLVGCCTGNLSKQDVEYLCCGESSAPVSVSHSDGVCGSCAKLSIHYTTCHQIVYQLRITSYWSYCDSLCLFHILWVGCFQSAQKHQSHPRRRLHQCQCKSRSWSQNPALADKYHQTPEENYWDDKLDYLQETIFKYQSIRCPTLKPIISARHCTDLVDCVGACASTGHSVGAGVSWVPDIGCVGGDHWAACGGRHYTF